MNDYGYNGSSYEASRGTMGAVNRMGAVAPPAPSPGYPVTGSVSPVQHAVNSPAQVRQDAANLRLLDYAAPDTGNAYDPKFREAVRLFQVKMGPSIVGPADGLIGPTTRAVIVDMVRGLGSNNAPGGQAVVPNGGGGSLQNASTSDGEGLIGYWPYGLAGLAALGLAYFAFKR
jgi:peptidoglycan hydrolase-like protein with peptidoglycan-binding domain